MLSELPDFEHVSVRQVEEAVSALRTYGDGAKVIAGGTDLLALMKDRVQGPKLPIPKVLIDIKPIEDMQRIDYERAQGLRIGAAVKIREVLDSKIIRKEFDLLSQTARTIATTQIRNIGTVGGNLCQKSRCPYFRHPDFLCHRKGGETCFAFSGEHKQYHAVMKYGKCASAHPSDLAPCLLALGAECVVAQGGGREVVIPLEKFFPEGNDQRDTVLRPDELLVSLRVPCPAEKSYQVFLKCRTRHSADFALASVAVALRVVKGVCMDARIVLGGVAPFPFRAVEAEERILERALDERLIGEASEGSVEGVRPLPQNAYKSDLTKALVNRALTSILHQMRM